MAAIKATQIDGDVSVGRNVAVGGSVRVQGRTKIKGNLTIEGWLEADNIKGINKGLFRTVESLNETYPVPQTGWCAIVGNTLPGPVYIAENGEWRATGEEGGQPILNITEYDERLGELGAEIVLAKEAANVNVNVNFLTGTDNTYTLQSALSAVAALVTPRPGTIMTYKTGEAEYALKRFVGSIDQWYYDSKWIDVDTDTKSCNVVVAAFDSTDEEKAHADVLASSIVGGGYAAIRVAISKLPATGGTIKLMNGTYSGIIKDGEESNPAANGDFVWINKPNIVLQGSGFGTVITTESANVSENLRVLQPGFIIKDLCLSHGYFESGTNKVEGIENVKINGIIPTPYEPKENTVSSLVVKPSAGIDGINRAIESLSQTGGVIVLEAGTYTGTAGVNLKYPNITIQGQGKKTIISREGSTNDIFVQDANAATLKNVVLRDLSIAHNASLVTRTYAKKQVVLQNCWIANKYINQTQETSNNIITVGNGMDFSTLYDAYASIDSTKPKATEANRYEIHVYGHTDEPNKITLNKQYVDIIGHGAVVEFSGTKLYNGIAEVTANIIDNQDANPELVENYGAVNNSTYRDIHFKRSGAMNSQNFPCVYVRSSNVTLINCTFENVTESLTPFDPTATPEGMDNPNGARRHGLVIECAKIGDENKTRLINCIGIGSPYGFMNTRGIYIIGGSPKLYNCIGYGGGMGERSHGIICHRYSQPKLFNCIGYGSPYTAANSNGECCGIRFQSSTAAELHNCIGYAGKSAKSSGISVWHASRPKLFNCVGYAGEGEQSAGLDVSQDATPYIQGGYYGVADDESFVGFAKNNGNRMTLPAFDCNVIIPKIVLWLITDKMTQSNVPVGTTLSIDTSDGQAVVANAPVNYSMSAMAILDTSRVVLQQGTNLIATFKDGNGNVVSVADGTVKFQIIYNKGINAAFGARMLNNIKGEYIGCTFRAAGADSIGVYLSNNCNPSIDRCSIDNVDGCSVKAETAKSNVDIRNSHILNNRSNSIVNISSFKAITPIMNSTNYN